MAKKVEVDLKLLIGAIALIIIATVGSAFATYLIFGGTGGSISGSAGTGTEEMAKREIGPTYDVGEFTVNLTTSTSHNRFIRTGIVLELDDRSLTSELERRHPQVRDRIISILRGKSVEQLRENDGLTVLRAQIIESLNGLLMRGEIIDVFFIDLVIQ